MIFSGVTSLTFLQILKSMGQASDLSSHHGDRVDVDGDVGA